MIFNMIDLLHDLPWERESDSKEFWVETSLMFR